MLSSKVNPEKYFVSMVVSVTASIGVAAIIVTLMAYRSGGRVTVNARTYIDNNTSQQ
ncbi:hypothetical protein KHA80_07345 [Anaerobacillus sp. HL2]|nr:hypothetical protein KHA80_07345 [Anaerobacillus sp. HL2]